MPSPPTLCSSRKVSAPPVSSMSEATIFAPACANPTAVTRPSPCAAPVTTTTLSWNENIDHLPTVSRLAQRGQDLGRRALAREQGALHLAVPGGGRFGAGPVQWTERLT